MDGEVKERVYILDITPLLPTIRNIVAETNMVLNEQMNIPSMDGLTERKFIKTIMHYSISKVIADRNDVSIMPTDGITPKIYWNSLVDRVHALYTTVFIFPTYSNILLDVVVINNNAHIFTYRS